MPTYFNINYEFDKNKIISEIDSCLDNKNVNYICVADGVILNTANRNPDYLKVINGGMFSICDSGFVPLYIKKLHGIRYQQYAGTDFFKDIVSSGKYRMFFLGSSNEVLQALKSKLSELNPGVGEMKFRELPYCKNAKDFNFKEIAKEINDDNPDIIFVSLGAPKQEYFMYYLRPYLNRGVMVAVGAAFDFCAGLNKKRAPQWMINSHLEFVYRLFQEPRKQSRRCFDIIRTLPILLLQESRRSPKSPKNLQK